MTINPNYIGNIADFQNHPIKIVIKNKDNTDNFIISVAPCKSIDSKYNGVYVVSWNNLRYSTTADNATQHVLTALEFARISSYGTEHDICINVPFYPCLRLPATEIEKALDIFKTAMASYF